MKKFWFDRNGAVTVIVSIMLIPAILLSGTAVDLARIHTAKSIAHNANQLAVNSVLTEYNALLKDLYGLFGVKEDDPELYDMVNEYIQVAIYGESGEKWIDTGMGTLQLFQGSTASADIVAAEGYDLGKADVLRRQIEDYMKFRGPVVLVTRLLDALQVQGSSVKASHDAIKQQEVVGEGMLELSRLYRNLYDAILVADRCEETLQNTVKPVSDRMNQIKTAFGELKACYANWDSVNGHIKNLVRDIEEEEQKPAPDMVKIAIWQNKKEMYEQELGEVENKYNAKRKHIEALVNGGNWQKWTVGQSVNKEESRTVVMHEDGKTPVLIWSKGGYTTGGTVSGSLQSIIDSVKNQVDTFKSNFDKVVTAAKNIDSKRTEMYREIETLQQKINDPNCDGNLKRELQIQIDECKALLDQFPNITGMATNYKTRGEQYIDVTVKGMLDKVKYEDKGDLGKGGLSAADLSTISSNSAFNLSPSKDANNSRAAHFADFSDVSCRIPPGFTKFRDIDDRANSNRGLYDQLKLMAEKSGSGKVETIDGLTDKSGSDDPEVRQRNIIEQLVTLADSAKKGLISEPEGARRIEDSAVVDGSIGGPKTDEIMALISNPGDAIQRAADWALMMTYDVSMFSNYTTGKPAHLAEKKNLLPAVSLTNAPISPEINYFYQSEWEYLLVGNKNAVTNLDKVRDLIYAIRLVCNTIAAFTVPDVKTTATNVKSAVTGIPYVGPALGVVLYFATFGAFAAAESAVDLIDLRNGCRVPLLKMNGEGWVCDTEGIVARMKKIASGSDDGGISGESIEAHNNEEKGISYEQYMIMFFLLTSDIDTLTLRTGRLIEWNVNNYKAKVNKNNMSDGKVNTDAAVSAMSAALASPECIRLEKMNTDFNITTTIDLRLFFLVMPMFQQQGSPFSNKFPVKATDYRGY